MGSALEFVPSRPDLAHFSQWTACRTPSDFPQLPCHPDPPKSDFQVPFCQLSEEFFNSSAWNRMLRDASRCFGQGNSGCWGGDFTFERCCIDSEAPLPAPLAESSEAQRAVAAASRPRTSDAQDQGERPKLGLCQCLGFGGVPWCAEAFALAFFCLRNMWWLLLLSLLAIHLFSTSGSFEQQSYKRWAMESDVFSTSQVAWTWLPELESPCRMVPIKL